MKVETEAGIEDHKVSTVAINNALATVETLCSDDDLIAEISKNIIKLKIFDHCQEFRIKVIRDKTKKNASFTWTLRHDFITNYPNLYTITLPINPTKSRKEWFFN